MKPKLHIFPILIMSASVVWILMAIQRWWIKYPDTSQLVLALLIGITALGGAIIYNWMHNIEDTIKFDKDNMNNRLDVLYDEINERR